jgi:alpha-galactosidase
MLLVLDGDEARGEGPTVRSRPFLLAAALLTFALRHAPTAPDAPPPNQPAEIRVAGDSIQIRYNGALIFNGRIKNPEALRAANPSVAREADAVDQAVAFYGGGPLEIAGTISASEQAFPCESDRPVRVQPIVRHSSGLSRSLLNQAVYDRKWDWVLSVDDQPPTSVRVTPVADGAQSRTFTLEARGSEIVLRFRPRFYQKHRGLRAFEPWTYVVWPTPIVGWCSWFAFFDKVTEQDVKRTADVISEILRPFGYEYLQIDDGYQRAAGLPELWLRPNDKFPSGLQAMASYIRQKGLKPGIWTNASFAQTDYAEQHKDLFVLDGAGSVARGNWINHPVDASVPAALDALVRPIYRGLRGMGWEYYKLDALRHLRYEGYNSFRDHFAKKGVDPADALRRYVEAVRQEIGDDRFLLACWGVRPEIVGLVDGCRLGTDGFSYAGLAQYNSFNNVVWRNDPDHIELSEKEAWRSTMVTSLTGSLFLLTDKPERYRTRFVEPAKRTAPVLVTMPGQIYDVDPSRSSQLARVDGEVSGRDPKPFDAGLTPAANLYLLEVNRPFESWVVLGRTGGQFDEIRFDELGLNPAGRYLVFEFWQKKYRGSHTGSFPPGPLPASFNSQVFIIRERLARPQVVATSRHITGGGVDLLDVQWKDGVLSGRSQVVGRDPYEIYITEPTGWTLAGMECGGGTTLPVEREGPVIKSGCRVEASGEIGWRARFRAGAVRRHTRAVLDGLPKRS